MVVNKEIGDNKRRISAIMMSNLIKYNWLQSEKRNLEIEKF